MHLGSLAVFMEEEDFAIDHLTTALNIARSERDSITESNVYSALPTCSIRVVKWTGPLTIWKRP